MNFRPLFRNLIRECGEVVNCDGMYIHFRKCGLREVESHEFVLVCVSSRKWLDVRPITLKRSRMSDSMSIGKIYRLIKSSDGSFKHIAHFPMVFGG